MEASNRQLAVDTPIENPLRVLFDGRKLLDGGIGVYIENAIMGLLAQPGVALTVILPKLLQESAEVRKREWFSQVEILIDDAKPYSLDEFFRMGRRIPWDQFDLFHTPHFILPYGCRIPSVVTVHDLIHLQCPERAYYPLVAKRLIRSTVRRATRVVTVSGGSYGAIEHLVGSNSRSAGKLRLVPNALDPFYLRRPQAPEYLQTRFGLKGDFLLAVFSMIKPHKGLDDLLDAFKAVKARGRLNGMGHEKFVADLKLVLVGRGTEALVEREALLEIAGTIKGVYVYGSVSKEELLNLYARSVGLVVPSLAEGFCLPVLEAHAQGTPVLARPVPAIMELATERDLIARDMSAAALSDAMTEFLKRHCSGQSGRGWPNLVRFGREDIGRALLQVYREASSEGRGIEL